jgi:two-component system, chemotaxis family, chemotaxis protein CheY
MHSGSQRAKTVFIIDDNVMMRSMLRLGATEAELSVIGEAATVQAALGRVPEIQPDIVLLDLGLPDGDGLALLSELKSMNSRVFIIVVSGNNEREVVRTAISRGAMGYIVKPFTIGSITDALVKAKRKLALR